MNQGQFKKGEKRPNQGRPKGSGKGRPLQSTINAREAIARFVDGNADRCQEWLDQIAEQDGPLKAFQCYADLLEYHIPKLARTEVSGPDGGPQRIMCGWLTPP